MHSSEYKQMAQVADNQGCDVLGFFPCANDPSLKRGVLVLLMNTTGRIQPEYRVTTYCFGEEEFGSGDYFQGDLTAAYTEFANRSLREVRKAVIA